MRPSAQERNTCYHMAVDNDNIELCLHALTHTSCAVDAANSRGETALNGATRYRKSNFERLLRVAAEFQRVPTVDYAELKLGKVRGEALFASEL